MSSPTRRLAALLAATDDEQLRTLFHRRGVHADVRWQNFFDAADALLEPDSIRRALTRLRHADAHSLQGFLCGNGLPSGSRNRLAADALILLGDDPAASAVPDAVAEQVRMMPAIPAPAAPDPVPPRAEPNATAHAAERAFTTTVAVSELLLQLGDGRLPLRPNGGVSAAERRRLTDAGFDADDLDALIGLGIAAGILATADRYAAVTEGADAWLHEPAPERWAALVHGFERSLPEALRHEHTPDEPASSDGHRQARGAGWIPLMAWDDAYPWDPDWPGSARTLRVQAHLLGLDEDGAEPVWTSALREGGRPEPDLLRPFLPAEVDRLFLQNDLTAIAPGPLAPAQDMRLRRVAHPESSAQAGQYRFTEDSVERGLAAGETPEGIREFLRGVSLTGLPQPLDYLISQVAERYGRIVVRADPTSGLTTIESSDLHLLHVLRVDQALRTLALELGPTGALYTPVSPSATVEILREARHPAVLIEDPPDLLAPPSPAEDPRLAFDDLIRRLRAADGADAEAAWRERTLLAAVRSRNTVQVEVALRDGSLRRFTLEATGLAGGRLRGRDRAADVERTLPMSSIRSVNLLTVEE